MNALTCTLGAIVLTAACSALAQPLPQYQRETFNCSLDGSRWPYLVQSVPEPKAILIYLHGHYSDETQGMTECIYNDGFGKVRRECLARQWLYVCAWYGGNTWMGPLGEQGLADLIGLLRQKWPGRPVYLCGGSMGGSCTLIFAARRPDLIDGALARCPAGDIEGYYQFAASAQGNATLQNIASAIRIHYTADGHVLQDELRARSAVLNAEKLTMPLHIIHGAKDTLIPVEGVRRLVARLQELGRPVKYVELPEGGHDSPIIEVDWTEAFDFVSGFRSEQPPRATQRQQGVRPMDWLPAALLCTALTLALAAQALPAESLRDKTLVVWASPSNLAQHGGSALTIDGRHGKFDAIVFGELCPARWMPGSTGFSRTQREQEAWPAETAASGEWVQIAIVYRDDQIAMYRNGEPYAAYQMPSPPETFGPGSVVIFGKRHLDVMQPQDSFVGTIKDARIYPEALGRETIAALQPGQATGPEPWAWWDFSSGTLTERTGRYAEVRIVGDVRMEPEGLVLGGDGASLIAYPQADDASARSTWDESEAVPRHVIESARNLRDHLLADRYRPGYHFCMPEDNGMPGDPNGALFWNGRYHLMYLYHDGRAFVWGHVSSKDLVHWRYHPMALGPGEGDTGIFSGGAFVDKAGVPTISYWGLSQGPGQGVCIARSADPDLDSWVKSPANPVVRSTHWGYTVQPGPDGTETVYGSADPSNIWIHDGRYYMLTGNLLVLNRYGKELGQVEHQGDTAYLLSSDDLEHWEYLHPFYESDRKWTHSGEDNMCPVFLPLPAGPEGGPPSDRHLLLFISHCDGCQYYVGRYEDDHFLPEQHGRMTWADNAYFAPEALIDDRGRLVMWSWILDNPPQEVIDAQGWQGIYGLPRLLWLGDDGTLRLRPADELEALRQHERSWANLGIPAGGRFDLEGLAGETLELEVTLPPGQAGTCRVRVCCSADRREETVIGYDVAEAKLKLDTTHSSLGFGRKLVEAAPLELAADEPLTLRVFVDRSIVEVYANDRQAIARRIYPTLEGTGVALVAGEEAAAVALVKAWELMPANPF